MANLTAAAKLSWGGLLLQGWVAKLVARLLTTAALRVLIQTSLKNHKWATLAKEWPTQSIPSKIYAKKFSSVLYFFQPLFLFFFTMRPKFPPPGYTARPVGESDGGVGGGGGLPEEQRNCQYFSWFLKNWKIVAECLACVANCFSKYIFPSFWDKLQNLWKKTVSAAPWEGGGCLDSVCLHLHSVFTLQVFSSLSSRSADLSPPVVFFSTLSFCLSRIFDFTQKHIFFNCTAYRHNLACIHVGALCNRLTVAVWTLAFPEQLLYTMWAADNFLRKYDLLSKSVYSFFPETWLFF